MLVALLVIVVALFVVLPIIGIALWTLLSVLVVGLVIGALARLVLPGRQQLSILATIGCGLIGSIIGGWLGQHVFGLPGIVTVLLEIVVAAGAVAVAGGSTSRRIGGSIR